MSREILREALRKNLKTEIFWTSSQKIIGWPFQNCTLGVQRYIAEVKFLKKKQIFRNFRTLSETPVKCSSVAMG